MDTDRNVTRLSFEGAENPCSVFLQCLRLFQKCYRVDATLTHRLFKTQNVSNNGLSYFFKLVFNLFYIQASQWILHE